MRTVEELEKTLVENPFDTKLRLELAELFMSQHQYDKSGIHFNLILKQDPEHQKALEGLSFLKKEKETENKGLNLAVNNSSSRIPNEKISNIVPFREDKSKISFSDIVGMESLKRTIRLKVIEPFRNPSLFSKFKKKGSDGILLYGPPGCGKTMLAKAIASECDLEFISVDISDILNMYIGESERSLAGVFERARDLGSCVLFFDELDALAISRSKASSHSARTLVNELLNQMDGFGKNNKNTLILGATNMPWDIDQAAKRSGRFSRQIFVPPLDKEARQELLRLALHGIPHDEGISLDMIADQSRGFSGADIVGVVELAKEYVLLDIIDKNHERSIGQQDLLNAIEEIEPSALEWLKTAKNLVNYGGVGNSYKDLSAYLRKKRD